MHQTLRVSTEGQGHKLHRHRYRQQVRYIAKATNNRIYIHSLSRKMKKKKS